MPQASISVCKGKGSLAHNNRGFVTENVDRDKIKDNIIYKQESLQYAYEYCFGQAVKEYNAKQKRADRRIDGSQGYMEQIRTSKNGEKLFYENVVQVGNMHDSHVGTEQGEVCKQILDEYMRGFQERNPNLYVFNAVMHLDEQTPHLHIDYIPVAHGYKNGLQARNSLDRAFKEQGVDGKANKFENRTIAWQNSEKDHIEGIMKEHGLERTPDTGLHQEHKSIAHYKAVVHDVRNEIKALPEQISSKPTLFDKEKLVINKKDLEQLEERAKLSLVYEKSAKQLMADFDKNVQDIKQSKIDAEKYIAKKMSLALMYEDSAEKKMAEADEMLKKYTLLYEKQRNLNDDYTTMSCDYYSLKRVLKEVTEENDFLKAQISHLKGSIDKRVQQAVNPLQRQIEGLKAHIQRLETRLRGMCQSLTNVTKAFGMLKHSKKDYRIQELTEPQSRLFQAIEEYSKKALRSEERGELADDIEKNVGIAPEIRAEIDDLIWKEEQNRKNRSQGHDDR